MLNPRFERKEPRVKRYCANIQKPLRSNLAVVSR
jgi:hypothetical protein